MVFIDTDAVQLCSIELGREPLPDGYRKGLGRGDTRGKFGNLFVQETVVHCIEHFPVHNFEPGALIYFSFDRNLEHVVMAVSVWVCTLSE